MAVGATGSSTGSLNGTYASLIESLLSLERRPIDDLDARKARIVTSQGILSDLGSKLSALRTALDNLRGAGALSPLSVFKTHSGDPDVVDATASSAASRGTHAVTVSQLARAHTLAGTGFAASGTSFAPGSYSFSVTVGGTVTQVSVEVASGDTNGTVLANAAQALNASGAATRA